MNRWMARIREWLARLTSHGVFGKPGSTQRPGRSGGGPAEGPMTGGSSGPAGPTGSA
jgi:hypothetical protein